MKRTEAVAQQLELDGMPDPEFDKLGFSDEELGKAQAKITMTRALLDRHPDLLDVARRLALTAAAERGHVGTRWLGEGIRLWLNDGATSDQLNNDSVSVLVRLLIDREPWLRGIFELRVCALDAILAGEVA